MADGRRAKRQGEQRDSPSGGEQIRCGSAVVVSRETGHAQGGKSWQELRRMERTVQGSSDAPSHHCRESMDCGKCLRHSIIIGRKYSQTGKSCQPESTGDRSKERRDTLRRAPRQSGNDNCRQASARGHAGRRGMPNFSRRYSNVVRCNARRAAAPCGPPMTQLVSRSTCMMCSRSTSSRV
jgi:hypothetical protein